MNQFEIENVVRSSRAGTFATIVIRRRLLPEALVLRIVRARAQTALRRLRKATPVRTGRLRRSAHAEVRVSGRNVIVQLGWRTDYSRYVEARTGIVRRQEEILRRALQRSLNSQRNRARARRARRSR